jgi:hypothetical protein
MDLMILARKATLEMIGETGSRKEKIAQDALELVVRRCIDLCAPSSGSGLVMAESIKEAIRKEFDLKLTTVNPNA